MVWLADHKWLYGLFRAHSRGRAGRSQQLPPTGAHLATGNLGAQQGVLAVQQLVADRREEVVVAQQVGDAALAADGDRSGVRLAQLAQHRQRVAAGGQGALDGRTEFPLVP